MSGITSTLSAVPGAAASGVTAGVTQARSALAVDVNALNSLKNPANAKSPQAAREVARQLESLFMREMIKSMRSATLKSDLFERSGSEDLAYDLFDQQLSVSMSGMPGGLSAVLTAQIARAMGIDEKEALRGLGTPGVGGMEGRTAFSGLGAASAGAVADAASTVHFASNRFARMAQAAGLQGTLANAATLDAYAPSPKGRDDFVRAHLGAAERVARESGIPANFMLGQAGLETGWGKSEIRGAGGANSFNLFGIKATGGWKGKVAEITTTEYVGGVAQKVKAKFRAYDSYEESFRDYARLITGNPRYAQAVQSTGNAQDYARALQNAGYATDPQYASKLRRTIEGVASVREAARGATAPTASMTAPTKAPTTAAPATTTASLAAQQRMQPALNPAALVSGLNPGLSALLQAERVSQQAAAPSTTALF